jgi:hypothetical protein
MLYLYCKKILKELDSVKSSNIRRLFDGVESRGSNGSRGSNRSRGSRGGRKN